MFSVIHFLSDDEYIYNEICMQQRDVLLMKVCETKRFLTPAFFYSLHYVNMCMKDAFHNLTVFSSKSVPNAE